MPKRHGPGRDHHLTSTEPGTTSLSRGPHLSDRVAEEVLRSIIERDLKAGDPLPSQRELGEMFRVSRTVVREAVRSLIAKGVVDVRSGSGLRVATTNSANVKESMNLFLRGVGSPSLANVWEVRKMLELHIVEVAAQRRTSSDMGQLQEACVSYAEALTAFETTADLEPVARQDVHFHRTLAQAAHNDLYLVLLDAIADPLMEIRRVAVRQGKPSSARTSLVFHEEIIARIAAGDPVGAREVMRAHWGYPLKRPCPGQRGRLAAKCLVTRPHGEPGPLKWIPPRAHMEDTEATWQDASNGDGQGG